MTRLTIQISDALRQQIEALAEAQGFTLDQFAASAMGEKYAALTSVEDLRAESAKAQPGALRRYFDAAPDVAPPERDRMDPDA